MELLSSHSLLLISIGVCAYISVLHLGLARGGEYINGWVTAWCLASLAFMGARYVQTHTVDPQTAVEAARAYGAMAPLLIFSLVGFVRALQPEPLRKETIVAAAVPVGVLSAMMVATEWFVPNVTQVETDWFGRDYITVPSPRAAATLGVLIAGGLLYAIRGVLRAPDLTRTDRALMLTAFGLYAAMGVVSVLSAADIVPVAGLAEFGPLIVCVGLNQTLVRRHARLRDSLGEAVASRTDELRAANRRLADRQAHYRALFDHVPAAVSVWSPEGDLLDLNRSAQTLLRLGDEIPKVNAFESVAMCESGAADMLRRAVTTRREAHAKLHLTSRERELDLLVTAVPMMNADGDGIDAVLEIAEDIGERRALEDGLRQAQKLEALGRLAAGIAHEINNPLAYVRSNLALLRDTWTSLPGLVDGEGGSAMSEALGDGDEVIDDTMAGVERVIALVGDIKGYAHSAPAPIGRHDLAQILTDSVRIAGVRRPPSVRIEEGYDPSLPLIACQPNRLEQVFVNLIANAIDAVSESGVVEVSTRLDGVNIVASVRDDGCGMDDETRQRILEPFFTTKPVGQGTGLGLYVARDIVHWHHGELRIESESGLGSCFEVWLPIDRDDDEASD